MSIILAARHLSKSRFYDENIVPCTQVCLMSQSWDNVASMHDHLLTVHAHKT